MKYKLKDKVPPLLTHTTYFTIFAAADAGESWWWGMTHGCAMTEAAVWASTLPAGAPGKKRPGKKDKQKTNNRSFWRVNSTLRSDTAALWQRRWRCKGNHQWLLLETQPEPLPAHRSSGRSASNVLCCQKIPSLLDHITMLNKYHLSLCTPVLDNATSYLSVM